MRTIVGHGLDKLLINGYMGETSKLKVNNLSAHQGGLANLLPIPGTYFYCFSMFLKCKHRTRFQTRE